MTFKGFQVIDCDGHVVEPWSLYESYVEAPFRDRTRDLMSNGSKTPNGVIGLINTLHDGRQWAPKKRILGAAQPWETAVELGDAVQKGTGRHPKARPLAGEDPHNTVKDLDDLGIDVFVGFGTRVTGLAGIPDPKLEAALVRAYNMWMRDFCSAYPDRLKAVAAIPVGDVELMVEEAERVAREKWCVGLVTMATHKNALADHPRWYPLYKVAEQNQLTICFHSGGSERPPYMPARHELGDNPWMMHLFGHPWGIQRAMAAAIGGGIYDQFPRLTFGYFEAWLGWVPGFINRLDGEAAKSELKSAIPKLLCKPSEHLAAPRSFFSFDPDEKYMPMAVNAIGAESIVWASDYPHFDCPWETMLTGVTEREELTKRQKQQILGENALKLFPRIGDLRR